MGLNENELIKLEIKAVDNGFVVTLPFHRKTYVATSYEMVMMILEDIVSNPPPLASVNVPQQA